MTVHAIDKPPTRSPVAPNLARYDEVRASFTWAAAAAELGQQGDGTSLAFARTLAVSTLVIGEIAYLLNSRFVHTPSWTREGVFGNRVVLLAIGVCLALQQSRHRSPTSSGGPQRSQRTTAPRRGWRRRTGGSPAESEADGATDRGFGEGDGADPQEERNTS